GVPPEGRRSLRAPRDRVEPASIPGGSTFHLEAFRAKNRTRARIVDERSDNIKPFPKCRSAQIATYSGAPDVRWIPRPFQYRPDRFPVAPVQVSLNLGRAGVRSLAFQMQP